MAQKDTADQNHELGIDILHDLRSSRYFVGRVRSSSLREEHAPSLWAFRSILSSRFLIGVVQQSVFILFLFASKIQQKNNDPS